MAGSGNNGLLIHWQGVALLWKTASRIALSTREADGWLSPHDLILRDSNYMASLSLGTLDSRAFLGLFSVRPSGQPL